MTTAEVAKELGYSAAKVRKIAASELGGYRSNSGQGCAWRFPRARVMDFKRRSEVGEQKSEASTVQELARELADLVQVSKQRETDLRYELEKLERRLSQVEAQADGRRERIAA